MISLHDRVSLDWKDAMKARDPKKDVLALVRTELKNRAISARTHGSSEGTDLDDLQALDVLKKMAKQRRESVESFKAGGRMDLAEKEAFELSVIESYLPAQLDERALERLVREHIELLGASGAQDMGKVMKAVLASAAGQADGNRVSACVKRCLGVS
ncbi:MAG: GatB/YqeY domain-containing protein [Myxococcaceae bacterium]|nr:GatB/YqeY domain-containing protein [Myxococcaceae bacterium]MBH2006082.1 GatB/YqeY domain-containing protein [Myxococcaceae bacterium]